MISRVVLPIPCADQLAVGLSVSLVVVPLTVSALSVAIRPNMIQEMSPNAVRLSGIDGGRRVAAKTVLPMARWSQMIGVHARRIIAGVVKFQAIGDGANPHLVGESVSPGRAAVVAVEDAIAALISRARPEPAIIWPGNGDVSQEPINGVHGPSIAQASGYDKREGNES
jgi:hypothetical protein